MGAGSHHPSVIEIDDGVGQQDGRDPVGHDQHRPVEFGAKGIEDLGLDQWVDRARRVVEQQDLRTASQGSGKGDSLALATRQRGAPLTDDRHLGIGEIGHEPIGPGDRQRAVDLFEADGSEGDIFDDRVGEEERLLEGDRNGSGPVVGGNITDCLLYTSDAADES